MGHQSCSHLPSYFLLSFFRQPLSLLLQLLGKINLLSLNGKGEGDHPCFQFLKSYKSVLNTNPNTGHLNTGNIQIVLDFNLSGTF